MSQVALEDVSQPLLHERAVRGVGFLLLRTGGVRLLSLAANVILSRVLSPETYGLYAVSLLILTLLAFVSDFGLGAALLQRREPLATAQLGTVFTVQLGLAAVLVAALALLAPLAASAYHLGPGGAWYVRAMCAAGFLAALKTVPTIVLERQLLYGRLALLEVVEILVLQSVAVTLALLGLGIWSFIAAMLSAQAVSLALSAALSGWRPRLDLDGAAFSQLWRFGLPFQLSWTTYLLRDYMIPIVGGLTVTTAQVGYLNWAMALAAVPGQLAQVVGRVSFPSFARLQDDPERLRAAVEASIRGLALLALPVQLGMMAAAPWLVDLVFSEKWRPALVPFYLLSIHWAGVSLTTPLVAALNATGRARFALALSSAWTLATIGLGIGLVRVLGYPGLALAYSLTIVLAAAGSVALVSRWIPIRLGPQAGYPAGCAVVAAAACFGARLVLPESFPDLALLVLGTAVLYAALLWAGEGGRLRSDARLVLAGWRR